MNPFTGHEAATTITPTIVRYHSTNVAILWTDINTVQLNHGGHITTTTKRRMNQALQWFGFPAKVTQKDFDWYITTPKGTFPYQNGAHITRDGDVTNKGL